MMFVQRRFGGSKLPGCFVCFYKNSLYNYIE